MHDTRSVDLVGSVHVMGEVAACRRNVGVALLSRAALFEMRGRPEGLGALAAWVTGRPALLGRSVRVEGGWWRSVTARRALVLAEPADPLPFAERVRGLAATAPDVALENLSAAYAAVILAGRGAGGLADSPAARLARPLMSACDGDDLRVLVLPNGRAADTRHVLLEAGRADGAIGVGLPAVTLYRAARPRPRRPALTIDPTTTGALRP